MRGEDGNRRSPGQVAFEALIDALEEGPGQRAAILAAAPYPPDGHPDILLGRAMARVRVSLVSRSIVGRVVVWELIGLTPLLRSGDLAEHVVREEFERIVVRPDLLPRDVWERLFHYTVRAMDFPAARRGEISRLIQQIREGAAIDACLAELSRAPGAFSDHTALGGDGAEVAMS